MTMTTEFQNPVFTQHDDGRITVDQFPLRMLISRELLATARPDCLHRRWRTVWIDVDNASALYRLERRDKMLLAFECRRTRP